ncbi:FAD-dependent monooxygenase [Streptosporangiaceae bacterium NEAU-GS5]|nr:FAD-dependent monooxygenase [Streptosporangiaceae bacterium NEAU-GS5]
MDILISGSGIAGPTLAYWLARHGFRPTVVERAAGLRSSGSPIDVRGPAVDIAEAMGAMDLIRAAGTGTTAMSFVNGSGRRAGRVNMRALERASGSRDVEIARSALAEILYATAKDHAEFVWGDSIASMEQDAHGVDVTFDKGAPRRFDLVIGADGLHSNVRRLAFGPESRFVRHMGMYVATTPFDGSIPDKGELVMYNAPGRAVAIHPSPGGPLAFFAFRSPEVAGFDHRDTLQHKRMLSDAFGKDGWRVPELLDRVRAADDLYFDSVSKVTLDSWSDGRIALLGDAASSVSLFGGGSTLAMAGAHTLAGELAATPVDVFGALRRYEAKHRIMVEPKQNAVEQASLLIVPATQRAIALRNLATRLWPVVAAGAYVRKAAKGMGSQLGRLRAS